MTQTKEKMTKAYRVACEERARLEQTVEDLAGQRATMTLRLQEAGTENIAIVFLIWVY